jgi:hypothetical protein
MADDTAPRPRKERQLKAIGHIKDDPDRLRRMADNLERANAGVRQRWAEAEGVLFLAS